MTDRDDSEGFASHVDPQKANPGAILRQARETMELSIDDLARRLRLEPRIVRHLEKNEFDQLPAPAFTRGYLRSIAKELGLDSAPLIAVVDQRFGTEPPALADFQSRAPTQITSNSTIIRYTTVGLVAVMIVMVALWWRAQNAATEQHNERVIPDEEPQDVAQTPPLGYEFEAINHSDAPIYRGLPEEVSEPVADDSPAAADLSSERSENEPTPVPDSDPDPGSAVDTAGDPEPDAAPAAGQGEILISAREDAWVEVRDGTGSRLFYNFVRSGQEVRLSGAPPYAFTIGNVEAVSLQYDGQAIALEPFSELGIARFVFPEDSAADRERVGNE